MERELKTPIRLLTVKETCRSLGVSRTRLDELRRAGAIRAVRLGPRGIRFPLAEIARFLDERVEARP